jgi:hypothetical protein
VVFWGVVGWRRRRRVRRRRGRRGLGFWGLNIVIIKKKERDLSYYCGGEGREEIGVGRKWMWGRERKRG